MLNGLLGFIRRLVSNPVFLYIVVAIILILSLGHYLGTHPSGFSQGEVAARGVSQNPSKIFKNPINAPHSLVAYLVHLSGASWKTSLRLSSALFWVLFSFCFYLLAKNLFGKQIGLMGTLIFGLTPIFAVLGRDGSATIMLGSSVTVMAMFAWATKSESDTWPRLYLAAAVALSVYVPGMLLLLIASVILCRKKIALLIEEGNPTTNVLAILLGLLIIAPLGVALAKDWTLIKQLLLIPVHFARPITIIKEIVWMGLGLFIHAPHPSQFSLGRLPLLSILADALFLFGAFALFSAARAKFLTYLLIISYAIIAAGFNDNVSLLVIAIPVIIITVTAGLRYLFIEWRGIFPRNPLAKSVALTLMWAVVIVQLFFGARYVLSAWPEAPATKTSYVLK